MAPARRAHGDRSEEVRRWLIQAALDAGLTGMEQALQRLTAPHNP